MTTMTTMTTPTTAGKGMFGRWAPVAALAMALGMGLAAPAAAQYQRVYPQRNNPRVIDTYYNGRWVQRVDTSQPGWIFELRADVRAPLSWVKYPANAPISPATTYYLLNNQQWVTLPQLQAAQAMSNRQRGPYAGEVGTIGGFTTGSSGPSSPLYSSVLGGVTTASQRTGVEQFLHGINAGSQQRNIDVWLRPQCDPRYMRCQ
jgi:hypothetical protein